MLFLKSISNIFKKRLINKQQELQLMQAIKLAEQKTSGEIRVHIEKKCEIEPTLRAQAIFKKLNMHKTKEHNGIIFYLALNTKQFAIWGDEGIHQKVNQPFWDDISAICISNFKNDLLIEGLAAGIILCGEKLKLHFPLQVDDINELSNDISY